MASGSGTELVTTGSDDGTVKVWEGGEEGGKVPVATFAVGCPVTAVCWGTDGNTIYVGAIDNEVHVRPFLQERLRISLHYGLYRCTIFAKVHNPPLSSVTPTHRPLSACHPMEIISFRRLSLPRQLSGIFDHFLLHPTGYIVSCRALLPGLRILFWKEHGAEMTAARESRLEEQTEWCVYGMQMAGKFCTRLLHYLPISVLSAELFQQLPGHKGTVTSVDFHPREPIGMYQDQT